MPYSLIKAAQRPAGKGSRINQILATFRALGHLPAAGGFGGPQQRQPRPTHPRGLPFRDTVISHPMGLGMPRPHPQPTHPLGVGQMGGGGYGGGQQNAQGPGMPQAPMLSPEEAEAQMMAQVRAWIQQQYGPATNQYNTPGRGMQ